MNACDIINERLAVTKALLPKASWPELIALASDSSVDLTAEGWFQPSDLTDNSYFVYCAACSTVEVDILTGEIEVSDDCIAVLAASCWCSFSLARRCFSFCV